jgi:hypothetical protein
MVKVLFRLSGSVSFALFILLGCSAPRQIIHSGKVTPKGHFKAGSNMQYNISTAAMEALFGEAKNQSEKISKSDTVVFDSTFNNVLKVLTIWSIDPFLPSTDFYVRYGIIDRFDIGFSRGNSVNVFDVRGQFLGPTGKIGASSPQRFYGSGGIQFSYQSYELPTYFGDVQKTLKYSLKRKDLLFPIAMSYSFGEEEKYGALGFGAVYGVSFISYEFDRTVYELIENKYKEIADVPQGNVVYGSSGMFVNVKAGYKMAYALAGLSIYYQKYGTYTLYKHEKVSYAGATIVPSVGLQLAF